MPLYPIIPVLAIAGSLFVLISTIITDTLSCALSLLIGLAGLPLYFWLKNGRKTDKNGSFYRSRFFLAKSRAKVDSKFTSFVILFKQDV